MIRIRLFTLIFLFFCITPFLAQEKLDVEGGIKLGSTVITEPGIIRWDSSELQCFVNDTLGWVSLSNPEPHLIGISNDSTSTRVTYNGKNGWQGANEMCKEAYPEYSNYVRAFTVDEITRAIILDNIINPTAIDGTIAWAISSSISGESAEIAFGSYSHSSAHNNALCLGTDAGGGGSGQGPGEVETMTIEIVLDHTTSTNGGGVILDFMNVSTQHVLGNILRPIICGCYK